MSLAPIHFGGIKARSFKEQLLGKSTPQELSVIQGSDDSCASIPIKDQVIKSTGSGESGFSWPFERMHNASSPSPKKEKPKGRMSFLPWRRKNSGEEKLGTVTGVFLPCISQILGVIFFLRLPTITAQAGTIGATIIIMVCVMSTFVTSLSLSAIATNGTIQAGGPYYIISRTLGIEIGGSLGMLFYLGTTLGGAMYVLGAVEAYQTNLDYYGAPAEEAAEEAMDDLVAFYEIEDDDVEEEEYVDPSADLSEGWFGPSQIASLCLMFILTAVVSVGMKYVNWSAGFFLATVTLTIASILLGTSLFAASLWDGSLASTDRVFFDNIWPHFSPDPKTDVTPDFFSLLALFYPSVTGIMAGTNRSAKLANPSKSIPTGTIGAISATSILYVCQVWLLGSVVAHKTLIENKLVVATIAFPSRALIKIGIITSCIGAALQCLTGAPQLLAAIAVDDAIPFLRFIKPSHIEEDIVTQESDPRMAIWVTYTIASLATLAGNLDHITPIITMFFLLMYGGINLCCFLLGWVNAPGFRPTFKYIHRNVSLFGFVLCLSMALVISWSMALISIGLFGINYFYIYKTRQELELETGEDRMGTNWGDVGDSLRYKITTTVLMSVTGTENLHAKNWRPQLLTIVDTNDMGVPVNMELLALAAQLKKGRGLHMMLSIKRGSLLKPGVFEASQECKSVLRKYMKKEGIAGFASIAVTHSDFNEAVISAVNHSGFGPISPNIVLLPWLKNWKDYPDKAEEYVKTIQGLTNMKRAVVLFKGGSSFPRCGDRVAKGSLIDIYWVVEEGGLCLLLPYLISKHKIWKNRAVLRIFAVATDIDEDLDLLEKSVINYCESVRIEAKVNVIDMSKTTIATDMTRWHIEEAGDCASDTAWHRMTISQAMTQDTLNTESPLDKFGSDVDDEASFVRQEASVVRQQRPMMGHTVGDRKGEEAQLYTAKLFNNAIRFYSHSSNLVVTNMPLVESMSGSSAFFAYIEQISMYVNNMLLVRGSEYEVVTTIA